MRVARLLPRLLLVLPAAALLLVSVSGVAIGQKKPKKPAPAASNAALVKAGKAVYDKIVCSACHAINGKGGKGGPDLSKIGAGHDAAFLTRQIRDPKKNNPASTMPAYDKDAISDADLKALVAYLRSLK